MTSLLRVLQYEGFKANLWQKSLPNDDVTAITCNRPDLSKNLFIYDSGPNDGKIEDVLFMQIQILNLLS